MANVVFASMVLRIGQKRIKQTKKNWVRVCVWRIYGKSQNKPKEFEHFQTMISGIFFRPKDKKQSFSHTLHSGTAERG